MFAGLRRRGAEFEFVLFAYLAAIVARADTSKRESVSY